MKKNSLNVDEIIEYLEITPPFLMIDSVEKIIPGKSCCRYEELASIYLWLFSLRFLHLMS